MINIDEFRKFRKKRHLIVLDTSTFLELYRQPANISLDIIAAFKKIVDRLYMPWQVYKEYIRNYQKVSGTERKKYQKVCKDLSESVWKLQDEIESKIIEYRKHNYIDISKLQNELNQKIDDVKTVIKDFENSHKAEMQLYLDFLDDDKVKAFVDLLEVEGKIGIEIPFSQQMLILKEGKVRFDNLIPPGFMDYEKQGVDKYGDLFIWKSIITIAKEQNANIIFVCNDIKEDWWEKDKELLIDLRIELLNEFKEINPFLDIHFLTLEKFFSYIEEELKIGKSQSALQLSAMDDMKEILDEYEEEIYRSIGNYLCTIDIEDELNEIFLEPGDEEIYWSIKTVSVEKENRNIIYYINLDISVLADLTYLEHGEYPCDAGKIALALVGKMKLVIEEYATTSELRELDVEKNDILHIAPDIWRIVKYTNPEDSCKNIIAASRIVEQYKKNIKQASEGIGRCNNNYGLSEIAKYNAEIQEKVIKPLGDISKLVPNPETIETLNAISKMVMPLQGREKQPATLRMVAKATEPLGKSDAKQSEED